MWNLALRLFRRLRDERRGAIAVEFALFAPMLVMLVTGGIEINRFILLNQKVERASVTVADLTSQAESLTESDITDLFQVIGQVVKPFDLTGVGKIIVSSVSARNGNSPRINWQRSFGALSNSSAFGGEGNTPTLPAGFVVRDNESLIIAEVFFNYTPIIVSNVVDPVTLYNVAYFRPRYGSLDQIN